jgi:hypothetical protein
MTLFGNNFKDIYFFILKIFYYFEFYDSAFNLRSTDLNFFSIFWGNEKWSNFESLSSFEILVINIKYLERLSKLLHFSLPQKMEKKLRSVLLKLKALS